MIKIKKVFKLVIMMIFLYQSIVFCIPEESFALRVPMYYNKPARELIKDQDRIDKTIAKVATIEEMLVGEELVRQVCVVSEFKTYIVADQLYSLVGSEDEDDYGMALSPEEAIKSSIEHTRISAFLKVASKSNLPGSSILQVLYRNGNVILLKASFFIRPDTKLKADSNGWNRTEDEVIMSSVWHERIHLGMDRLEPNLLEKICDVIAKSESKKVIGIRQIVVEEYGCEVGSKANTEEVIAYITTMIRDTERVRSFINNTFPSELANIIINIWEKSRPTEEEVAELRNVARGMLSYINDLSYTSVVIEDMIKGSGARVDEVIMQFLAAKLLSQAL